MVALGPLTNLALALNIWPEWSSYLKDIYVMGGNISGMNMSIITTIHYNSVYLITDDEFSIFLFVNILIA